MLQATWVNHHFTDDIQTRQYRCPEVLLGARWGPSADIWSVACVVRSIDLVTRRGFAFVDDRICLVSYLNSSLAGITSLTHRRGRGIARMRITSRRSSSLSASSRNPSHFRESTAHGSSTAKVKLTHFYYPVSFGTWTCSQNTPLKGELRHISKLRFWPLEDVLHDKYEFTREIAQTIASFLSPMVRLNPEKRAGAGELVHHRWLDGTVVQGEIDVIRRAEEEEARRRQPSSSSSTGSLSHLSAGTDVDALKPVDDDPHTTDDERPSGAGGTSGGGGASGTSGVNAPPTLQMPRPASATAKENLKQALAKQQQQQQGASTSASGSGSQSRKRS
jgi:serine/threonine-protein kinase SRPK3